MKKDYEKPIVMIEKFDQEDVIVTSGIVNFNDIPEGE